MNAVKYYHISGYLLLTIRNVQKKFGKINFTRVIDDDQQLSKRERERERERVSHALYVRYILMSNYPL
jgi:hypothetical protein